VFSSLVIHLNEFCRNNDESLENYSNNLDTDNSKLTQLSKAVVVENCIQIITWRFDAQLRIKPPLADFDYEAYVIRNFYICLMRTFFERTFTIFLMLSLNLSSILTAHKSNHLVADFSYSQPIKEFSHSTSVWTKTYMVLMSYVPAKNTVGCGCVTCWNIQDWF